MPKLKILTYEKRFLTCCKIQDLIKTGLTEYEALVKLTETRSDKTGFGRSYKSSYGKYLKFKQKYFPLKKYEQLTSSQRVAAAKKDSRLIYRGKARMKKFDEIRNTPNNEYLDRKENKRFQQVFDKLDEQKQSEYLEKMNEEHGNRRYENP